MSLCFFATSILVTLATASYSPFLPEPAAIFLESGKIWYDNITNPSAWSPTKTSEDFYHGFFHVKHLRHTSHLSRSFYVPHTSEDDRLLLFVNFSFIIGCGFDTDTSGLWYNFEYSGDRLIYKNLHSFGIDPDINGIYDFEIRKSNSYTYRYCYDNITSVDSIDNIDDFSLWGDISISRTFALSNNNDDDDSNGQNNVLTLFFGGSVNEMDSEDNIHGVWGLHSVSIEVVYENEWTKGEYEQETSATNSDGSNSNSNSDFYDTASGHVKTGVNYILSLPWWAVGLIIIGLILAKVLFIFIVYKVIKFICIWAKRPQVYKQSWSRQSSDLGENLELINRQSSLFVSNVFNDEIMKKPVWDHDSDGSDDINSNESSPKKRNKSKKRKDSKSSSASSSTRFEFRLFDVTKRPKLPTTNETFNENSLCSPNHYVQESTADMDDLLLSVDSLLSRSKQSSTPRWTMMSPQANMNLNLLDLNKIASSIMHPFSGGTNNGGGNTTNNNNIKKSETESFLNRISPSNTRVITGQQPNGSNISPSGRSYAMVRNDRSGSIIESNFDIPENASELSDTDYQALLFQDMQQQQDGLQVISSVPVLSPKKTVIDYSKFNIADETLDPNNKSISQLNTISEAKHESYHTSTASDQGETDPNDVIDTMNEMLGARDEQIAKIGKNNKNSKYNKKKGLKTIDIMGEGYNDITNNNNKDFEDDSDGSLSVNDQDAIDTSGTGSGNESTETEIEDDSGSSILNVTDSTNLNNGAADDELNEFEMQDMSNKHNNNNNNNNQGKGKRKSISQNLRDKFRLGATPEDDDDEEPEDKPKRKITFPSFNSYMHMKSRKERNQSLGAFSDL